MNKNTTATEIIGKGVRLLIEGGELVEKPSLNQILDEIELTFMNPIRSAQYILDYGDASKGQAEMAESLLHTTIMHWDKFQRDLADCFRYPLKSEKGKSIFEDDKFIEYLCQIKVNGGNPTKILEDWIKEHTPYHLEDD